MPNRSTRRPFRTAFALLAAVSATQCHHRESLVGFRWPEEWSSVRVTHKAASDGERNVLNLVRYQIAECERIQAAYTQLAENRSGRGVSLGIAGGIGAGLGAAFSATAQVLPDTEQRQPLGVFLTASGVTSSLVAAGLLATAIAMGSDRATPYHDAANDVRDAVHDFRAFVRDKDSAFFTGSMPMSMRPELTEQLCTLRATCREKRFYIRRVGHEFPDNPAEHTTLRRLHDTLEQVCAQPATPCEDVRAADALPLAPTDAGAPPEAVCQENSATAGAMAPDAALPMSAPDASTIVP